MAGPIVISVLANTASANRNLRVTAGLSQRMGSGFRSMAAPATAALGAIAIAAKGSVDAASDLSEAQSKNAVIFGRQAGQIEKFSSRAATALGQSQTVALDAAATFGQIGQKAGLGGRETAAFAKQFTTLASDLASFNNTTPEEAIEAIGAAMRGEAEPIRKYGVLLDDATLRQEALRLGLVKTVKDALSPQQKALAASSAIMAQTTKAQGDFARTSEGAANKQRIVAAQVENLKAKLGTQLLPVYQKVLGIVSRVVEFFTKHQTVAKVLVGVLALLAASIIAVNIAMLANPASLVVAGLVAVGAGLYYAYKRSETFRNIVQSVGRYLRDDVVPALRTFGNYIRTTVIPAVVALARRVAANLKPVLEQAAKTLRNDIIPAARAAAAKFQEWWPTIRRVTIITATLIARVIEFNSRVAGRMLPIITRVAGFLIGRLVPAGLQTASIFFRMAGAVVQFALRVAGAVAAVARFANGVRQKVGEALAVVASLPIRITAAVGNLGSRLYSAGIQLVEGLINGIRAAAGRAAAAAADVVTGAINSARSRLGINSPSRVFTEIGKQSGDGYIIGLGKRGSAARQAGSNFARAVLLGVRAGSDGIDKALGSISAFVKDRVDLKDAGDERRREAAVLKGLRAQFKALSENGKAQDRVNRKLDAAISRHKSLVKASKDYAAGIKASFVQFGSIVGRGVVEDGAPEGTVSLTLMLDELRERAKKAEQFRQLVDKLRKTNLSRTALQQILDAGLEGGGLETADAITRGGASAIAEINRLQAEIARSGGGLGETMANQFHGAGIKAAAGLVRGLRSRQRDLDAAATRMATALVRAVRRQLGIKSPSRVFRDLGDQTMRGLEIGLDETRAKRAGAAVALGIKSGFARPALAIPSGDLTGGASQPVTIVLKPDRTALQAGRDQVVTVDVARAAGVRRLAVGGP